MTKLFSAVEGSAIIALALVLGVGCGDDTGTGASTQGGGSPGGGSQGGGDEGGGVLGGGSDGGAGAGDACAYQGGAPAGDTPAEITCGEGCVRVVEITCELGCVETPNCVADCVSYVDQPGPTAQCEQARLALFQCVADAINADVCDCSGDGGTLSCEVCGPQKDALAFCK